MPPVIRRTRARAAILIAAAAVAGCTTSSSPAGIIDAGADSDPVVIDAGPDVPVFSAHLEDLQRAYTELRFGMFIHFGILTYTGTWAQPNLDITQFNPTKLDPNQWADAAVAAHMAYGVLTTRHHDGFALWPSQASTFNVGNIPWMNGQGDVVRAYVDAFRAHGLLPGLYYSIWDATEGLGTKGAKAAATADQMNYIETQLTELLTNYGPIPLLIFDGWSWKMGHRNVDYAEIRRLVKSLQPDCLMLDNTHLSSPYENDLVGVEEAEGNAFVPEDNTFPATQMQKINAMGGNDWFWSPTIGGLMTTTKIIANHLQILEPRWGNFLLNCPPNRDGLLDDAIVNTARRRRQELEPRHHAPAAAAAGPADPAAVRPGRRHRDQRAPSRQRDRRLQRLLPLHDLGDDGSAAAIDHHRPRPVVSRRQPGQLPAAQRKQRGAERRRRDHRLRDRGQRRRHQLHHRHHRHAGLPTPR